MMEIFDAVKEEVQEEDSGIVGWQCNGTVYKIPLMNGSRSKQEEFLEYADKYEKSADGLPSELVDVLGEFMYRLLKMKNPVTKEECEDISTVPNCQQVYNLWLGN
jgi:hypothetical protein